jgi:hypothetical protein
VNEIASDDATPTQPIGAEPTRDRRNGGELDRATAHQELNTNTDGAAIEKSHSPSPQPFDGNDPTVTAGPVGFLDTFFGEKPWALVAIRKAPKDVQAKTFLPAADRDESAAGWVLKWNGRAAMTSTSRSTR